MDDVNELTPEEAKFFETRGQSGLEEKEPELPGVAEKEPEEKPAEKEPEAKTETDKKPPAEIEVVEDDDGEGEPDARKYVKVGVLRREREKAKEARLAQQQQAQQLAELTRQIQELKNPPRELQAEEVPHVALQRVQQIEQALNESAAKQQFIGKYQQAAAQFAQQQPDFAQAYNHALGVRRTMYETAGYAPEQVNALMESEEAAIVERAFLSGENPAAKLYKIAQTLGYKPAAAKTTEKAAPDKLVDSAEKLAKIAEGMNKNKSTAGGGSADNAPTLQEIADMDDAEFDKIAGDPKKWKKLMGG